MDIEQMQKIWDSQNQQVMYAINEEALYDSIRKKSKSAEQRINKVEIGLMTINFVVATIVLIDYLKGSDEGLWDLGLSLGIYGTVAFLYIFRNRRKSMEETFDRTMLGELNYAISSTDSIIRISWLMITAYILPIMIFSVSKMIYQGASLNKWLLMMGAFALSYTLILIERKKMHLPRKRRLETLRDKLEGE